jgi:hypothetical protein
VQCFRFVRLAFAVDVKWAFDGAKKRKDILEKEYGLVVFLGKM